MESQIHQALENVRQHHFSAIAEAIDESIHGLKNLIRLDEYHRHGHDESRLKETMGPFGSTNLNLASLSQILGKSSSQRCLQEDRLERVNGLLEKLKDFKESGSATLSTRAEINIEEDETVIHEKAEAHLNQVANIFRNLRIAQLEIRTKYDARIHDPVFEHFNWRQLSPAELRLCPPFLITAHLNSRSGPTLRKIMSLLESRKPFKIVALRTSLLKFYSPTSNPSVPATMAVEMIPLAMRGVYFLQTCISARDYEKRLFEALTSPRPGLLSLLSQKPGEDEKTFRRRADGALRSRAFPVVLYDPDAAQRFVSCFDLSANPEMDRGCTFAHYAAGEEEFAREFTDPAPGTSPDDLIPISDYLDLTRHQRLGKYPCVYLCNDKEKLHPKIVSEAVVTQTSDQNHLWRTLEEIAGVDNPYVNDTRVTLQEEFGVQQKALLESLQQEKEKAETHREQVATAATIRKLVAHFTGVDPMEIDLKHLMTTKPGSGKKAN